MYQYYKPAIARNKRSKKKPLTTLEIKREHQVNCTIGEGVVKSLGVTKFTFKTLELPWANNEKRVSCIPKGTYKTIKHRSPKFKECFWLQNVPNRSEILIHSGNYTSQILGCILPGKRHVDINGDGILDVTDSKLTISELYKVLPDEFDTIIK